MISIQAIMSFSSLYVTQSLYVHAAVNKNIRMAISLPKVPFTVRGNARIQKQNAYGAK